MQQYICVQNVSFRHPMDSIWQRDVTIDILVLSRAVCSTVQPDNSTSVGLAVLITMWSSTWLIIFLRLRPATNTRKGPPRMWQLSCPYMCDVKVCASQCVSIPL